MISTFITNFSSSLWNYLWFIRQRIIYGIMFDYSLENSQFKLNVYKSIVHSKKR